MSNNKTANLDINFDDSWALVELYRWQYGELPTETHNKPLDISKALSNCAENMKNNDIPSIFNVMTVLGYLGRTYDF